MKRALLTDKQVEILAHIYRASCSRGYPPTVRELVAELHLASTNSVACRLRPLIARGYVSLSPGLARGLVMNALPVFASFDGRQAELVDFLPPTRERGGDVGGRLVSRGGTVAAQGIGEGVP